MTAPFDRAVTLTKNLKLEKQGLEIGPLDKPIVPKKGTGVLYADHLPTDKLREKYRGDEPHPRYRHRSRPLGHKGCSRIAPIQLCSCLPCDRTHPEPAGVAGQRWRIEESFQAAKGLIGQDQHQVRRWRSWYRWTTLAMLAHAFLAAATAVERDTAPSPAGLIALMVNDFRRLFDALLLVTNHTITTLLAWSRWRRRHQYRARQSHYRRREHQ